MEQLTLFREEEAPLVGPLPKRLPAELRAGTRLDHRWTQAIYVGKVKHGLLDTSQRIYQGGGEIGQFVFWKHRIVTIDARVWIQVKDKVDWIEMVDHNGNQVWRISIQKAVKSMSMYNAGIGNRIGIPMAEWSVYDHTGKQVR